MKNNFNVPTINVLWQLVASKRFSMDDPKLGEMMEIVSRMFLGSHLMNDRLLMAFPSLRHLSDFIPGLFNGYAEKINNHKAVHNLLTEFLDEHKESFDPGNVRDVIDAYLKESEVVRIL